MMHIVNNTISNGIRVVRVPSNYFTSLGLHDPSHPLFWQKELELADVLSSNVSLFLHSSAGSFASPNREDD